jgi:hypothetical protein
MKNYFLILTRTGTYQLELQLLSLSAFSATYYSSENFIPYFAVAAVTQSSPLSWYADAGVAAHRSLAAGAAFSVRWRGLVRPPTAGQWTIGCEVRGGSDDGVRLLWEGAVVADGFSGNVNGSNVSGVVGVGVANGYYEVGIEYYSLSGASGIDFVFYSSENPNEQFPCSRTFYSPSITNSSPIVVLSSSVCSSRTLVSGPGLSLATAGMISTFRILLEDQYSNPKMNDVSFLVSLYNGVSGCLLKNYSVIQVSSYFSIDYIVTRAGTFSIAIGLLQQGASVELMQMLYLLKALIA